MQQQQQLAGAKKRAGNRKQQPKERPAAATPASKRKQQPAAAVQPIKRKQQPAAAGSKTTAAAAPPGKRKREQLEAGTHYFCLDTNVLLQQAQLGMRAAWQAIAASPDSSAQLLVPLVRWAGLWAAKGVSVSQAGVLPEAEMPALLQQAELYRCLASHTNRAPVGAPTPCPASSPAHPVPQEVLQELKHTAKNWRHTARFAAQGALTLLGRAMPCHARCRVQW